MYSWLKLFENRLLRRIFGPKIEVGSNTDWRNLLNEEFYDSCLSENIISTNA
jgi:hypothetical protein